MDVAEAERLLFEEALRDPANQRFVLLSDRRPPVDASLGEKNIKFQHDCVSDEYYVQTLFAMNDLDAELERRTVTFSLWNQPRRSIGNITWHPCTFSYQTSGPQQIEQIKDIKVVYYETEFRVERCSNNSTSVPCYLFARKFSRGAAMRL